MIIIIIIITTIIIKVMPYYLALPVSNLHFMYMYMLTSFKFIQQRFTYHKSSIKPPLK